MKLRMGFVSNSSTTSFCIFGCTMGTGEAIEQLFKAGVISQEEKDGEDNRWDILYELQKKLSIEIHTPEYDDETYFGFDFTVIPDDVNVGEWKKEKEAELKKLLGDNISCDVLMEAWRDG